MKRLSFKIDKNGNATLVDACGYGTGCQAATQDIEALLGKADDATRADTASLYDKVDHLVLKNEA